MRATDARIAASSAAGRGQRVSAISIAILVLLGLIAALLLGAAALTSRLFRGRSADRPAPAPAPARDELLPTQVAAMGMLCGGPGPAGDRADGRGIEAAPRRLGSAGGWIG